MGKKYLVDEEQLYQFIKAEIELNALNYGGVDNWEWCGESIRNYIADYNELNHTECECISDIARQLMNNYEVYSDN